MFIGHLLLLINWTNLADKICMRKLGMFVLSLVAPFAFSVVPVFAVDPCSETKIQDEIGFCKNEKDLTSSAKKIFAAGLGTFANQQESLNQEPEEACKNKEFADLSKLQKTLLKLDSLQSGYKTDNQQQAGLDKLIKKTVGFCKSTIAKSVMDIVSDANGNNPVGLCSASKNLTQAYSQLKLLGEIRLTTIDQTQRLHQDDCVKDLNDLQKYKDFQENLCPYKKEGQELFEKLEKCEELDKRAKEIKEKQNQIFDEMIKQGMVKAPVTPPGAPPGDPAPGSSNDPGHTSPGASVDGGGNPKAAGSELGDRGTKGSGGSGWNAVYWGAGLAAAGGLGYLGGKFAVHRGLLGSKKLYGNPKPDSTVGETIPPKKDLPKQSGCVTPGQTSDSSLGSHLLSDPNTPKSMIDIIKGSDVGQTIQPLCSDPDSLFADPQKDQVPSNTKFKGFEFTNSEILARKDYPEKQASGWFDLPDFMQKDYVTTEFPGIKLSLFREVKELQDIVHSTAEMREVKMATSCAEHRKKKLDLIQELQTSPGECSVVKSNLNTSFQTIFKACELSEDPEHYFDDMTTLEFPFLKYNEALPQLLERKATIDEVINWVAVGLKYVNIPENLKQPLLIAKLRLVLRKIKSDQSLDKLQKAIDGYANISNDLDSKKSCFLMEGEAFSELKEKIAKLKDEALSAKTELETIVNNGLSQQRQELRDLEANGKHRLQLPYPSLTAREREFFSLFMGGVLWRMRGAGIFATRNTQTQRTYFVRLGFGAIGELNGGVHGKAAANEMFWKLITKGWSDIFDFGTHSNDVWSDLLDSIDRGYYQTGGSEAEINKHGYHILALRSAGLHFGPCYNYQQQVLPATITPIGDPPQAPYVNSPFLGGHFASWGEFCWGSALGLGLSRSLLSGYSGKP